MLDAAPAGSLMPLYLAEQSATADSAAWLGRYHQLDPEHEGPLSGADLDRHFKQALCDKVTPS